MYVLLNITQWKEFGKIGPILEKENRIVTKFES